MIIVVNTDYNNYYILNSANVYSHILLFKQPTLQVRAWCPQNLSSLISITHQIKSDTKTWTHNSAEQYV